MKKILPVGHPLVMTYKNYGIPLAIMANAPESRIWIINRFLQLYTRSEINNDYHWLQFYLIHDSLTDNYSHNPWLKIQKFDLSWLTDDQSAAAFIRARIDDGCYIELNGDQYYLSHTFAYEKRHRFSNLLIHGYDHEEQVYHVLDFTFTTTRQFQSMTIPYSNLVLHIEGMPTKPLKIIQLCEDAAAELNVSLIHQLLGDYLHSRSTPARLEMLPKSNDKAVYGLGVYAKFEEYLHALIAHTSYASILPFQLLYEHKRCVKELVHYLHQTNRFQNRAAGDNMTKDAESLLNTTLAFRNAKLKFLRRQDKAIFNEMLNMIPQMKERDKQLCEAILSELRQET
ncbi:hypothetical protein DUZ99_15085 [Xylanibacillus composti]|uniref:Uncharacterized protein n=1 Tax=Xylanibacillus composti TaxID=1572762 RepID=A0A8J4M393_9BACL|nr:hypothetical protein [Xylanibacillus composti]MDT9726305.1 hypothetical protein [Xylanibacillus composti]GIQ70665.1 hypothetical protein XYCOK13_34890 [Xylanibacillus composti]